MQQLIHNITIVILLAPLIGSIIAGILGKKIGRSGAHWITILGVGIAFICAIYIFKLIVIDAVPAFNGTLYVWVMSGNALFNAGILIDRLSASMMLMVTFVSLLVHIYSIGYMHDDSGYQRFFSYMSLFTFSMLSLVCANNFAMLFFGWEAVGLVSYLLIGFWYTKESAAQGSFKAFLVNRMGDFGFILGIAAIMDSFGSLDYANVFAKAPAILHSAANVMPSTHWSLITVICILLFIGAMGKSAQMPLHVWLPESMEGPTPISALIHAATMVTAGVYMVARLSPLYELSPVALSVVMVIGATGALFMGIIGLVQNDIKRVIAYSTISQLGYMMAGVGASAFSAGIFHLMTHACFKALLFLSAGSVIIAMHHEQNLMKMGGLRKYMPVTYITFLIGALALAAIPPFAGYYSKDAIIDAVLRTTTPGAYYSYICLLFGAFITALYIFRAFFLAFHTHERMDTKTRLDLRESSWVVLVPLIILAIPSVILGIIIAGPMLYEGSGLLGSSIYVLPQNNVMAELAKSYHGAWFSLLQAFVSLPFWFALAGIIMAWLCYIKYPFIPSLIVMRFTLIYQIMLDKYGFDRLNDFVFVRGGRALSNFFYYVTDVKLLDDWVVNGSGRGINKVSQWMRRLQTGYLYHYVFAMILGLFVFLVWLLLIK